MTNQSNQSAEIKTDSVENLGMYFPYNATKLPAEIAGTRIIPCLYKTVGGKAPAQANSYVRIPSKYLEENNIKAALPELLPHIKSWLESIQDSIIKADHKSGLLYCYHEKLALSGLLEYLDVSNESGRITKESIGSWFDELVSPELTDSFAAKLSVSLEPSEADLVNPAYLLSVQKLEKVVAQYKELFCSLAGGKTFIPEANCIALIKALESIEAAKNSNLGQRFIVRLNNMIEKSKNSENLLELL